MPAYADDEGTAISTHSMIKSFRRCPKQFDYKYIQRLKPKHISLPLKRGTWLHSTLEHYYRALQEGKSREEAIEAGWAIHTSLTYQFGELFEEERENYGDLPGDVARIFRSYLWHYEDEEWEVHDVEFMLETTFPDGTIYRCKIDALIEDQFGLWLVDHKSHKSLPNHEYRILESQSALYLWAALKNKIPVQGFIFNYLVTKPASIPEPIQDGSRISRWDSMATDYPTAIEGLKKHGFYTKSGIKPYAAKLKRLKAMKYEPGAPQISPYFQRAVVEKSTDMLKRIAMEAYHTSNRMHEYFPPPHPDAVERVPDRSCSYFCSYTELCSTELWGGNTLPILKQYNEGDPLEYYTDDRMEDAEHGD